MVALVLLPGMDGTGSLFEPLVERVEDSFQVQVIRYPATEALGYEALVARVLAALPSEEPFFLLGESFSGPIAISIAATRPANLLGLILCSTFAVNPRPVLSALRPFVGILPPKLAPVAILDYLLLGRYSNERLRRALASAVAQVSSAAFHARLSDVQSVNVLCKLKAISVPVVYLQAVEDKVVPPSAAALIQRELPGMRIVPIAAPHCLLQAKPDEAAATIRQFAETTR